MRSSCLKNCVYPRKFFWYTPWSDRSWQRECQRQTTATTNIFLLSERLVIVVFIDDNYASDQGAQIHVSIIGNYFGIILEVTGQYRGSVSDGLQQQPTFSCYLDFILSFFSSITITLHIKTLKPMCLSSNHTWNNSRSYGSRHCVNQQ